MSIDALVSGVLQAKPQRRTTKAGKPFATATVRSPVRGGTDGGAVCFVSVICFDDAAVAALLALDAGDSVSLAGEATPKVYAPAGGEPRASLDLLAHAVVSPYSVQRKRQAARGTGESGEHQGDRHQARGPGGVAPWQPPGEPSRREPFNDPMPF
jgi:single-stranded DNA-binding protein